SIEQKYSQWRADYVRSWGELVYIDYNKKGEVEQKNAITCSEAIGYGMLISVLMHNQQDFDGLVRWFLHFKNKNGLLAWQQIDDKHNRTYSNAPDGGSNSATDGDVDVATALFYAARLWGRSPCGRYDYRQIAVPLCKAILEHEINPYTFMPTLGDWYGEESEYKDVTRPSDFILSGFLTFYNEDVERCEEWRKVLDSIIITIQHQLTLNHTGLIADFLKQSANGYYEPSAKKILESDNDKDYNWNSCRVPWRLSVYYLLTRDERIRPALMAQSNFFGSLSEIHAGYHLNGHKISDRSYSDLSYTAPASVVMWTM
ncbi:Six-hairpin glycosidase-like protein, partial [Linnemannia elongata]